MISRRLAFNLPRGATFDADSAITQRPRNGLAMSVHHRAVSESIRQSPGEALVG